MKKLFLVAAALSLLFVTAARADLESSAVAHVYVNVSENVGVQASTPIVDAGSIQTGDFTATAQFSVQANQEQLQLLVDASDLWKGDDPTNTDVSPIVVKTSEGADVKAANGNPLAGQSTVLPFVGTDTVNGFPTQKTAVRTYESSQNGIWNQLVTVKVTYNQPDPLKPKGEYSGVIRLTAMMP